MIIIISKLCLVHFNCPSGPTGCRLHNVRWPDGGIKVSEFRHQLVHAFGWRVGWSGAWMGWMTSWKSQGSGVRSLGWVALGWVIFVVVAHPTWGSVAGSWGKSSSTWRRGWSSHLRWRWVWSGCHRVCSAFTVIRRGCSLVFMTSVTICDGWWRIVVVLSGWFVNETWKYNK